ncbi:MULTISPECIES: GntR family transcriptional regulator [Gemella]|uniref:GntR family transcriptional regulator n=1 Tax=Gemella TaxID=1378 RepID=UPI0007681582|nr:MULTISPECIES: GntR family transcriptional regulator [Gemella]AME09764.1 GntR family transcriptional regulator [Gemella sp. oral taxon 928]AXI27363.1 GntR family transcriptional regulator [Gemella sp. ND 6198]
MDIKISNLSDVPIYQQIASQIKKYILNGIIKENEQLPSIRNLAKELEVGIITIKKSYEVLLAENLIYSKGAVGYFVSNINIEQILLIKKEEYLNELSILIDRALKDGLQIFDIRNIIDNILEEKDYVNNK